MALVTAGATRLRGHVDLRDCPATSGALRGDPLTACMTEEASRVLREAGSRSRPAASGALRGEQLPLLFSLLLERDLLVEVAEELFAEFEESFPLLALAYWQFPDSASHPSQGSQCGASLFGREQRLHAVEVEQSPFDHRVRPPTFTR